MFNIFKRRPVSAPTSPDVRTHVVNATGGRQLAAELRAGSALRRRTTPHFQDDQAPKRGMWVRYQDHTGILTNLEPGDVATVMIVDDMDGHNVLEMHVPATQLRQAYHDEIPVKRRPEPEHSAKFGYVRRPS